MNNKTELINTDPKVFDIISKEAFRQSNKIQMIASENMASKAVMEAQSSVLTNKYAEGYPGKRYYQGCEYADEVEKLAIDRLCDLFGCKYANVQPNSGSQANQAVFLSLLSPGDKFMGFSLDCGGHLTHGSRVNMSGKWFDSVQYPVDKKTYLIDMNVVEEIALKHRPKLIIAGASAYPRKIDFKAFREIADRVGAIFLADIAHYSGLIAGGVYPSPVKYADVITSTTHKTLRGPRGAIIMTNDESLAKKFNSAVFPGMQGGPFMNVIAAKAVSFLEASHQSFVDYCRCVIDNARAFSERLIANQIDVITHGTDCHIVLVDLRSYGLKGSIVSDQLNSIGIVCNKNSVPFDVESPFKTSGLRFGTPFETTRGLKEKDFKDIADIVVQVIKSGVKLSLSDQIIHILKQYQ